MKKKIFCLIVFVLIIFSISLNASMNVFATSSDAKMIVACPGEDSSVEMNINWHAPLDKTQSYVLYTTKDDTTWSNAIKVEGVGVYNNVFDGIYSKTSSGENFYEEAKFLNYSVTLTDLTPDTEYMYRVGQDNLSDPQYFKTAGNTSFSFAWISDFHAYNPIPGRLTSAMNMINTLYEYNNGFDFIFSTGDEIAWGGSYSFWEPLFNHANHKNYMWASVIGNHDYMDRTSTKSSNDFFKTVYNNPKNGYVGEEGVCYYFMYSNVLFITLNNETQTSAEEVKKAQDWFEEVVQKNPAQYIIVAQHYQWFNGITGSFNNSSGYGRWCELFDKYNVDLAFSGNNHIYVRSKPLYDGRVSTDSSYGTTYIQATSSDNERGQAMEDLQYNKNLIANRFTEGGKTISGIIVNVNEEKIKIELIDRNKTLIDSVSIKARRDVYPMNDFSKSNFEEDIKYYQGKNASEGVLKFSDEGLGYIKSIEVRNNDANKTLISKSTFRKHKNTYLPISGISSSNDIVNVLITYKDETYKEVLVKLNTKEVQGKISNYDVSVVEEGYKVEFTNSSNIESLKLYLNGIYLKDVILDNNINDIIFESENKSTDDVLTIKGFIDDFEIFSHDLKYYSSTDVNCDGVVNQDDVLYLQKLLCSTNIDEQLKLNYDFNNDNMLDVIDITYLKMFVDEVISTPKNKQFKIEIINYDGSRNIYYCDANSNFDYEVPNIEGYEFICLSNDLSLINSNMVVEAIFMEK